MATQPPDPEIEKLLAELRSDAAFRRIAAAENIAQLGLNSAEVVDALKAVAETDAVIPVRQAAVNALKSLSEPPIARRPSPPKLPATPAKPVSRRAKIVQFTIGFVGWYALNWVAWFAWGAQKPGFTLQGNAVESYGLLGLCLWPANVLAPIILAVPRPGRWIALGLVAAIASNFIIALIIGASTGAYCFIPFFTPGLR